MTDNLRDRIAAVVIRHHTDCDDTVDGTWTQCECDAGWRSEDEWAVHVADAVITALGLREEFGALDSEQGGFLADTREQLTLGRGEAMYRRFITDWETHE